jgi:hypothetical protein
VVDRLTATPAVPVENANSKIWLRYPGFGAFMLDADDIDSPALA